MQPVTYHVRDVYDVELLPGDIVFCRGDGWLSRAILAASRSRGEDESEASHVALVTEPGDLFRARVVEAVVPRVRSTTIAGAYADGMAGVSVARLVERPSDSQAERLVAAAQALVGVRYGLGKLPLHALDTLAAWTLARERVTWFRRLGNWSRWPVCSLLVTRCYDAAGITTPGGVDWRFAQPDDILDACRSEGGRWSWPIGRDVSPLPDLDLAE